MGRAADTDRETKMDTAADTEAAADTDTAADTRSATDTDTMIHTTYRNTTGQTYFSFSNLEQEFKEAMEMKGKLKLLKEDRVKEVD
jgi:hypothetical protein